MTGRRDRPAGASTVALWHAQSMSMRQTTAEPSQPEPVAPLITEPELTPHEAALIAEACSKSNLVWLRPEGETHRRASWHVWHDDAVHVVYGVGEQMLPLLEGFVEVVARSKDTGARLVTFQAFAERLVARTEAWEAAADALSAKRLNAVDQAGQRDRWASGALLIRLTPLRMISSGLGDDSTGDDAAEPAGSRARTVGVQPFHLRGRARREQRRRARG